jgi:hypothetical protein
MKAAALLLSLLLSGCGGYVTAEEYAKITKLCDANGGVDTIWKFVNTEYTCTNGASFNQIDLEQKP